MSQLQNNHKVKELTHDIRFEL